MNNEENRSVTSIANTKTPNNEQDDMDNVDRQQPRHDVNR
jgi:hypothetical protein